MGIEAGQRAELDKTLQDLKLNKDEIDKFSKAFKDPEFLKLFEEYAKEVSDPKVKEETDQYLRQLESEGRGEEVYGKGVQLVAPKEAYVIKTRVKADTSKVFINICTSDKLEKATTKTCTGPDGKKGTHFEIPLSLGAMKTGADKAGKPSFVWDFVVHPETVTMALSNRAINTMLADTAMERIEEVSQSIKPPGLKLDRKFKMLNIKYKETEGCPKPQVLAVRPTGSNSSSASGRVKPVNPNAAAPDLLQKTDGTQGKENASTATHEANAAANEGGNTNSRSKFAFPEPKAKPSKPPQQLAPDQAGYRHASGEVTPHWELVHRGEVDLAEAWGDAGRAIAVNTTHPKELVLRAQLPGVVSAAGVELDASGQRLILVVPGRFWLETALPFQVDDARGRARFDKAKQQLEVVLPVVPPPRPATPAAWPPAADDDDDDDAVIVTTTASPANGDEVTEQAENDADKQEVTECGLQPNDNCSGACGRQTEACVPTEASADDMPPPAGDPNNKADLTLNQLRWMELHATAAAAAAANEQAKAVATHAEGIASQNSERKDSGGSASDVPTNATEQASATADCSSSAASAAAALAAAGFASPLPTPKQAAAQPQTTQAATPVQLKPRLNCTFVEDLD